MHRYAEFKFMESLGAHIRKRVLDRLDCQAEKAKASGTKTLPGGHCGTESTESDVTDEFDRAVLHVVGRAATEAAAEAIIADQTASCCSEPCQSNH